MVNTPDKVAASQHYRRFVYNLRDILYAVSALPDKAASRSLIHWDHTPEAIRDVFTFVKELRGRLIMTDSSDQNVWVVSSLDTFEGRTTLTTIMFNNHRHAITVQPTIGIPPGYRLVEREVSTWRRSPGSLELSLHLVDSQQSTWDIPGRLASKIVQTLEPLPGNHPSPSLPGRSTLALNYFSARAGWLAPATSSSQSQSSSASRRNGQNYGCCSRAYAVIRALSVSLVSTTLYRLPSPGITVCSSLIFHWM